MQTYIDEQDIQEAEVKRCINFGRFVALCYVALVVPWVIFFLFHDDWLSIRHTAGAITPTIIFLGMTFTRFNYLGRVLWLSMLIFAGLHRSYFFGIYIDSELTSLLLLALPLLLFSSLVERRTQIVMTVAVILSAIGSLSFDMLGWHPVRPPLPNVIPEQSDFGIRMTVVLTLMAQMVYFVYLNLRRTGDVLKSLRKANQASKAKGQFLANMSHEIRTPMNGMLGMLEVLEVEGLREDQRPLVGTIRNSALSLLRILDDILDASKIESGKMDISSSKMELIPVVEGVSQTLRIMADDNSVRIRHYLDPNLPYWIVGDSGRLRQILLNLLSNAVKYSSATLTGRDGVIWFLVGLDKQGNLQFTIRDNGVGMNAKTLATIFDPFVQGDGPRKMQTSGTGLGLVIAQNLVTLMGGTLTVKSTEGDGSEFVFTLPLTSAEGPPTLPDIEGRKIFYMYDEDSDEEIHYLHGFFKDCKVEATRVHSVAEALEVGRALNTPLFLFRSMEAEGSQEMIKALRAGISGVRFLTFSPSRAAHFGRVSADTYLVQIRPIRISELVKGVDVMTRPDGHVSGSSEHIRPKEHPEPDLFDMSKRILAVEDNEINRAVLAKQLELLGLTYKMVSNGRDGFDCWKAGDIDLIITDCHMPIMDGFEMAKQIRAEEAQNGLPHTPIIAITADVIEVKLELCRKAGMDDALRKPVELNELRSKLATFLGK